MVLSTKQRDDLHKAILGYLQSAGLAQSFATLAAELAEPNGATPLELDASHSDLLEKKWTSLIRMQKKILELEQINAQLREDLESAGKGRKIDLTATLPRAPPRSSLTGHRDSVTAVLFHPVYSLLFSASEDATIRVWDYETSKFERSLQGHQDSVTGLAVSPSGSVLASSSADLSIKLWEIESNTYGCIRTLLGHDHTVSSVSFTPTGDFLVSASRDKSIKVWEVSTGYCVRTLVGHEQWVRQCIVAPTPMTSAHLTAIAGGAVPTTAVSAQSNVAHIVLASCSMDQTIRLWNMKTGDCLAVLNEHTHVIEHIAFSNQFADQHINQWRNEESISAATSTSSSSTSYNHTSSALTAMQRAKASLEAANGTASPASTPLPAPPSTALSQGGEYLLSASRDKSIKLWHLLTRTCVRTFNVHDNWVRAVLFHPSGRFFLSASDDKSIRCFDFTKQAKCVKTIEQAHALFVSAIDWNRATPLLASGGVDHAVNLWDCR